ncbi:hypothetical protein [Ramlibacter cellulosilyticus]|nr:hypothetical protein [Ramlibacter cellulosilyticus]
MKIATASKVLAAVAAAASLAGCYVVPLQPTPAPAGPTVVVPAAPPQPVTFTARLYPSNPLATSYGMVAAVVTNDLNGRGRFSTALDGESFMGEATRVAGSQRDGVANGAGSRGSYLNCRYTMNSPTMGTGTCVHSSGATFTMHIGS